MYQEEKEAIYSILLELKRINEKLERIYPPNPLELRAKWHREDLENGNITREVYLERMEALKQDFLRR